MEARFGVDFGRVRVHADGAAQRSAEQMGARAYAVGRHVVFGAGAYRTGSAATRELLAHELAHTVQQRGQATDPIPPRIPVGGQDDPAEREAREFASGGRPSITAGPLRLRRVPNPGNVCLMPGTTAPGESGVGCRVLTPENCATYEMWVRTFDDMNVFTARDTATGGTPTGKEVLGDVPADVEHSTQTTSDDPVSPIRPRLSDQFIDRPTQEWVRQCLPSHLRETAYRLPSDCADIAIILRHVWLAAHGRTESYVGRNAAGQNQNWVVGSRTGQARQREIGRIIAEVGTGNLRAMVAPHADASGRPLRSLTDLQDRLHPGDVMIWEHRRNGRRTGGHAHTIQSITRDATGNITGFTMLQGNLPVGATQAAEIRTQTGTSNPNAPGADPLRREPGRRIERARLTPGTDINDVNGVLTWHGSSVLIVAGPPESARRPRQRGAQRSVADWLPSLRSASVTTLQGRFEAAMLEARSTIDGGQAFTAADAQAVGQAAGERLWANARREVRARRDFGDRSHFDLLHRLRATVRALGGIQPTVPASQRTPRAAIVMARFREIDTALELAARGISGVALNRAVPSGMTLLKFLVTGFDPFVGGSAGPPAGEWNPSGAAALALDGETLRPGPRSRAAVEGAAMPVSFRDFGTGMVESLVGRAGAQGVDAVVTTSMAPSIGGTQPVRLEQFAVGVHNLVPLRTHRLFPTQPQSLSGLAAIPTAPTGAVGDPIIESTTDTRTLAQQTGRVRGQPRAIQGIDVDLEFDTPADAASAFQALNLTSSSILSGPTVRVAEIGALRRIVQSSQPIRGRQGVRISVGGQSFDANILRGPGGSFLSNEISYRTLRAIANDPALAGVQSFHVHTPRGTRITGTAAQQSRARRESRSTLNRLLDTMRRILIALARRILSARGITP